MRAASRRWGGRECSRGVSEPSCTISVFQLLASSGTAVLPCSPRTFGVSASLHQHARRHTSTHRHRYRLSKGLVHSAIGFGERLTADVAEEDAETASVRIWTGWFVIWLFSVLFKCCVVATDCPKKNWRRKLKKTKSAPMRTVEESSLLSARPSSHN